MTALSTQNARVGVRFFLASVARHSTPSLTRKTSCRAKILIDPTSVSRASSSGAHFGFCCRDKILVNFPTENQNGSMSISTVSMVDNSRAQHLIFTVGVGRRVGCARAFRFNSSRAVNQFTVWCKVHNTSHPASMTNNKARRNQPKLGMTQHVCTHVSRINMPRVQPLSL